MLPMLKKQLLIYCAVLVVLALIQHPDLLISPLDRFSKLPNAIVYGMGAFHPFIFAFFGYLCVTLLGFVFSLIKKLFIV